MSELNHFSYNSEIEELFVQLRGRHLMLSPADWNLIESWKERGVPLAVASRAIEETMKAAQRGGRRINLLSYCAPAVEEAFAVYLKSRVGSHAPAAAAAKHIEANWLKVAIDAVDFAMQIEGASFREAIGGLPPFRDEVHREIVLMYFAEKRGLKLEVAA